MSFSAYLIAVGVGALVLVCIAVTLVIARRYTDRVNSAVVRNAQACDADSDEIAELKAALGRALDRIGALEREVADLKRANVPASPRHARPDSPAPLALPAPPSIRDALNEPAWNGDTPTWNSLAGRLASITPADLWAPPVEIGRMPEVLVARNSHTDTQLIPRITDAETVTGELVTAR